MDREWGSKPIGGRGAASGQNDAIDQIESYKCKICLKVHNNERDYLSHLHAHFQERKFRDEIDVYDSVFSEPPHLSNWFSSYVYESESESMKDLEIKKETPTKIDDLVSYKIDDMTDSQAAYSELVVEDSDIDDGLIDKNRRSLCYVWWMNLYTSLLCLVVNFRLMNAFCFYITRFVFNLYMENIVSKCQINSLLNKI